MFDRRKVAADKLKDCIRERGYTEASFSQMTGIPKQEIEKLLNAEVDNRYTFEKYIKMILTALNLSAENLMLFSIQKSVLSCPASGSFDLQMNEKIKKQYNLLWDIVDLCMIYYDDV